MANLQINTRPPSQLGAPQRTWGDPPSKAGDTWFAIYCCLTVLRGTLDFQVIVPVPASLANDVMTSELMAVAWVNFELPRVLVEYDRWDFFRAKELGAPDQAFDTALPQQRLIDLEVTLNEGIALCAAQAREHLDRVERQFDQARQQLWDNAEHLTPFGFERSLAEATRHLRFIEQVLDAGADVGGYEPHQARSALTNYQELARRKDVSKHGYQHALDSLRKFAHGVAFPSTWSRRPEL